MERILCFFFLILSAIEKYIVDGMVYNGLVDKFID